MADTMQAGRAAAERTLRRRLALARWALLWEATWPLFWPIPTLVALFAALALFDLLPQLPGWLHAGVLAAFAAALAFGLWRLRRLRLPMVDAARRRVERDNALPHGPLQLLADRLAAGGDDPVAAALWQAYRRRLQDVLLRLRPSLPAPVLARHDPYGLRFAALLMLAVALAGTWHDAPRRLVRALSPNMDWIIGPPPQLQAWITPPDYTHVAPMLLGNLPAGEPVNVPAGSRLLAELQGGDGQAKLDIAGDTKTFQLLDPGSQRIETILAASGTLAVRQGWRKVATWTVNVAPNRPPTIAFASPPQPDPQGRLRFDVNVGDEFGVAKAWVMIRRVGAPADEAPLQVELPLAGGHPTKARQASWHDLTGHPWAGLKVTIEPQAKNEAGLVGTGEPVTLTLPERHFSNPVARAIIELRRQLAGNPKDREPVVEGLEGLAAVPDTFGHDVVVSLALGDAAARLTYDQSAAAIPNVLDTLWQTALRLEEGDRPAAERSMNDAAQALEKALDENAPQSEIDRLTNELQQAIARYLQALMQQAMRQGMQPAQPDANQRTVTPRELGDMLQQMRKLSETGSRDAARQMLESLRQMLEGLQAQMQAGGSPEAQQQARDAANALAGIARDQQALLDRTFRRAHQGSTGQSAPDQEDAGSQEGIRHRLGDAMQMLGDMGADIPDAFGEAEQAMRDATRALGQGDLDGAVQAQTEALSKLQQGNKQAMQGLGQKMGPGMGMGTGMMSQPGSAGRDPLGRQLNGQGSGDGDTVKIPTESDIQKARQVLDELRRRESQVQRPADERDYLERLLRQFY